MVPALKVINVKGDGHCYYRCIWRLAKADCNIADVLMVYDIDYEDEGTQEVRDCVARYLRLDYDFRHTIEHIIEFKKNVDIDITEECPLYKYINIEKDVKWNCEHLGDVVEETNIMASSIEHEVIMKLLSDIDIAIIILTWLPGETMEDISDKWLRQLYKYMPTIQENKVCIIVNENNIHYKYCEIFGMSTISKEVLSMYIEERMQSDSD